MHTVKIGPDRWLEEGFKKGLAEARAQNFARGFAKGKMEVKSEVAIRMIEEGMDLDFVCHVIGLKRGELSPPKRKQA